MFRCQLKGIYFFFKKQEVFTKKKKLVVLEQKKVQLLSSENAIKLTRSFSQRTHAFSFGEILIKNALNL